MAKVLVIRKTDKTIHKVAMSNKAALMAYSNRLPKGQQWVFEEMDEKEADKLPFIDDSYVTAGEAQVKVKDLQSSLSEKDARIAELMKKLDQLQEGSSNKSEGSSDKKEGTSDKNANTLTVVETVAKINEAQTEEEVNAIVGADERKGVTDAATKKVASFK